MIRNKVAANSHSVAAASRVLPPFLTPRAQGRSLARSMFICSERTSVASRHENAVAVSVAARGSSGGKYSAVRGLAARPRLRERGRIRKWTRVCMVNHAEYVMDPRANNVFRGPILHHRPSEL